MVRDADVVGVATVQSATAREERETGLIVTDFRLVFSDVWKGDPGREFVLVKPGGQLGAERTSLPGFEFVLQKGEPIVVFASPRRTGNHNVIGIHQGLYRVGPGSEHPLYRVSEFPRSVGKSSILTLQGLKDEVSRALGRPVEASPARPGPNPSPAQMPSEGAPLPPPVAPTANASVPPSQPVETRPWGGFFILFLTLLVGVVILLARKKQESNS